MERVKIHNEELLADWDLAIRGETIFKIDLLSLLRKVVFRHCDPEERKGKQSQRADY